MIRRSVATVLLVAVAFVTGCGGDDDSDRADLPGTELLALADLPAGWQEASAADPPDCLAGIDVGAAATGTVTFERDDTRLHEIVIRHDEPTGAQEAYSTAVTTAVDCPATEISFPRIGVESSTFRLDGRVVLLTRKGDRLVYLAADDADELEPLARVAVDKLPA